MYYTLDLRFAFSHKLRSIKKMFHVKQKKDRIKAVFFISIFRLLYGFNLGDIGYLLF
jgi:hypothetical protein